MKTYGAKYLFFTLLCSFILVPLSLSAGYPDSSLLSSGRWIKVKVTQPGIYRLSAAQLEEWGFNDISAITVAGYGSVERAHSLDTAPSDLPVLPVLRSGGDVYFYGEGSERIQLTNSAACNVHRNYYSEGSYYFISQVPGLPSPDMESVEIEASSDDPDDIFDAHTCVQYHKFEQMVNHSAGIFYFSNDFAGKELSAVFNMDHYSSGGTLKFRYIGTHGETSNQSISFAVEGDMKLQRTFSDSGIGRSTKDDNCLYIRSGEFSVGLSANKVASPERFTARWASADGSKFTSLNLEYATLFYSRTNVYSGTPLRMDYYNPGEGTVVGVSNLSRATGRVIDVSTPTAPVLLPLTGMGGNTACVLRGAKHESLVAFEPSEAVPAPTFVGEVGEMPDLYAMESVDMLIVTSDAAYNSCQRLAHAHEQYQGMKVAVVKQRDVFNQFSSGALHPNGLRNLCRMLHKRQDRPLRYLLLVGEVNFDTRGVFSQTPLEGPDGVVMYYSEDHTNTSFDSRDYCADSYFGIFTDNVESRLENCKTKALELGIGRIPFSGSKLESVIDKTIACLADPMAGGVFNKAIIWGGLSDDNAHINSAENMAAIAVDALPGMTVAKPHHSFFKKSSYSQDSKEHQRRLNYLFAGDNSFVAFTGHGGISQVDHFDLQTNEVGSLHFGNYPFMAMFSCSSNRFDAGSASLGTALLENKSGPVGVLSAVRSVYLTYNEDFAQKLVRQLYSAESGDCFGDVYRKAFAKEILDPEQTSVANRFVNLMSYNYLGDPALPVKSRVGKVIVNEINGEPCGSESLAIPALTETVVKGSVVDDNGNLLDGFNGTLDFTCYLAPKTKSTLSGGSYGYSDASVSKKLDEDALFTVSAPVKAGRWETKVMPPLNSDSEPGRISLLASAPDYTIAAAELACVSITDPTSDSGIEDTEAPEIAILLNGSPLQGRMIDSDAVFDITLVDRGTGVGISPIGVGGRPILMLDGVIIDNAGASFSSVSSSELHSTYRRSEFENGHHILTVRATDRVGNQSSASMEFVWGSVVTEGELLFSDRITRSGIEFDVTHPLADVKASSLIIRDEAGETVATIPSPSFPFTWDYTDKDGNAVPDGHYRASVLLSGSQQYAHTPEVKFTVVK